MADVDQSAEAAGAGECQRRLCGECRSSSRHPHEHRAGTAQHRGRVVGERNAEDGVNWVDSYVGADKRTTFCIYDGPTPEAIRKAATRNGQPLDQITEVRVLDPFFYA
ncbi:MAG: DUF4242 domain-containing protein [Solirubrobacteraceae bacterium]